MTDEKIKKIISPDTKKENRIPPGQFESRAKKWPTLNIEKPPEFNIEEWRLTIDGLVRKKIELNYNELKNLGLTEIYADFHCVTSFSILNCTWVGVQALEIKKVVSIHPEAKAVMLYAPGKYTTNLTIEEFFNEDVLLAFQLNGKDLTPLQGFPLRLVVPKLYAYKSIKWINRIEFINENTAGYWEEKGYHLHGDPWGEDRYL
ncbi:molybdopterin-dependent oxidoreductase [Candidatus Dependentiae bacterium]|nr:molybdopterin-dependent oxidoreductase [Candidatus Dependentiae bacterium]